MKNLVEELKKIVPFKNSTVEGDIILVAAKQPQMLFYASVTKIERDMTRRDEWWHIHFTVLSVPMQHMTWTLRTEQMTGQEIFTMGGEERFIQAVEVGEPTTRKEPDHSNNDTPVKSKKSPLKRIK